jgi:hypothetical protein
VSWRRGRKQVAQQVVLPSLDRLSGLIERVVELVDAVGETPPAAEPKPAAEPAAAAAPALGWVAFLSSAHGYRLVEGEGEAPRAGTTIELEGASHRVVRVGRSPLPGDRRRCVYLEREEPRPEGRTSDA